MVASEAPSTSQLIPGSMVTDAEGQVAYLFSIEEVDGQRQAVLQLPHKHRIRVTARLLRRQQGISYLLPFSFTEVAERLSDTTFLLEKADIRKQQEFGN